MAGVNRVLACMLVILFVLGSMSVVQANGDGEAIRLFGALWSDAANAPSRSGGTTPGTDAIGPDDRSPESTADSPLRRGGGREDDAGDRLFEHRRIHLKIHPIDTDTDDDGLTDQEEYLRGTDPTSADTDADGLGDAEELALGTDPKVADTDGDRLLDGWEARNRTPSGVRLPGADPLGMDLYIQVNYGASSARLSPADERIVREAFDRMPVSNPDGSTGITVHVDDEGPLGGRVDAAVAVDDPAEQPRIKDGYYAEPYLGDRVGVYHQVLLVRIDDRVGVAGVGDVPGYFAVIDADRTKSHSGTIPLRDRAIVHELLHNVVGRIDGQRNERQGSYLPISNSRHDPYHTDAGWLSADPQKLNRHEFLPASVAEQFEEEGFSSRPEIADSNRTADPN